MKRVGAMARTESEQRPSHSQRLAALGRANQIRSERAQVKAALRRGELRVAELVLDPPECLQTASLAEILLAVPGVGKVRLRHLLNCARLSPAKHFGRLTKRQRRELCRALGGRG